MDTSPLRSRTPAIAAVPYRASVPRSFYAAKGRVTSGLRGFSLLGPKPPSAGKGSSANFASTEFSEVGSGSQRNNSVGAIHNRLTKEIAKQTSKAIDSKVRYDSWLLKWMNSTPDETEKPDRISAATIRTGPTSKKYQKSVSYQKKIPRATSVPAAIT